jgi:hypothetical protein
MKTKRQKSRVLNNLSAYLDDALSAKERQELETRLEREPALQQRLKSLRKTKIILGYLPHQQAPRNFTLTPDMVADRTRKKPPLFTALKFASSLAAILLVVLFGVEIMLGRGLQIGPITAKAPMMETAILADESTPEPMLLWVEPEDQNGRSDEEPILESEASPAERGIDDQHPSETPGSEVLPEISIAEEKSPDADIDILELDPDESGDHSTTGDPTVHDVESALAWQDMIRHLQIALAVLAVGGGLGLLILRSWHPS